MIEFASQLENIALVDEFILELKKEHVLNEKLYHDILLSVNEAVTNAIKHGNRNDPSKKIVVQFSSPAPDRFIFTVSDEGGGFNWHKMPDPLRPETIGRTGGRGIFIMKRLANHLLFNEQGSKVELHFIR